MTAIRMISSILLLMLMQSGVLCARRFRGGRNPQPRRTPPPTYRADRGDTTESFPLDFTAVEENMDNFMTQVKNLAQSLYPCSAQKLDYDMKLNFLENTSVTCNDGSPAGYVPTVITVWSIMIPMWLDHRQVRAGSSVRPEARMNCYLLQQGVSLAILLPEVTHMYLARGGECAHWSSPFPPWFIAYVQKW